MKNNFKCRASKGGALMTNARKKGEILSQTTKTYLEDWAKEQIYGVRKEIKSKYLTKGTELEDQGIEKAIEWGKITVKNELFLEDEHFTGTPDIITPQCIYDIKCSWDCFTFPLFEQELPTKDYFYQVQIYMHLTGIKKAKVVYVLLNTPEEFDKFGSQYDYSSVDPGKRIKVFEELTKKVELSRQYINQL